LWRLWCALAELVVVVVVVVHSTKRGHFFPTWNQRYAEFIAAEGKFEYYTDKSKSKRKGGLMIFKDSTISLKGKGHAGLATVVVSGTGGSIRMHTASDDETNKWYVAFKTYRESL